MDFSSLSELVFIALYDVAAGGVWIIKL